MSYAGYAARGSDVFGYAGTASDKSPYTILNYANGPGYKSIMKNGKRYVPELEEMSMSNFFFKQTLVLNSNFWRWNRVPVAVNQSERERNSRRRWRGRVRKRSMGSHVYGCNGGKCSAIFDEFGSLHQSRREMSRSEAEITLNISFTSKPTVIFKNY